MSHSPTPQSNARKPEPGRPWPDQPHHHAAGAPEEAFQPGFTMADAFVVLLIGLVAQFVVAAVFAVVGADLASARVVALVTILSQGAGIGLSLWWLRARGHALWPLTGPVRPRLLHVAIGVGVGLVGVVLVLLVGEVVTRIAPDSAPPEQVLLEVFGQDLLATVGVMLAAVVFAPVQEELTYRALVFQTTRAKIGLPGGLVLSALVFAGVHVEVWNSAPAIVGLIVLALWLAAVFHQTGSLVVPVVAHATYNASMLGLAAVLQDMPTV